jgi:hypothetical protein
LRVAEDRRSSALPAYLESVREVERLARRRLVDDPPPTPEERRMAETVIRHAVGLRRLLHTWIAFGR